MAIYEYRCLSCEHTFQQLESVTDHGRRKVACPKCKSSKVERVFTSFYAKTIRKS